MEPFLEQIDGQEPGGVTYAQTFDVENRLTSVAGNGKTATFAYDADGNRILTIDKTGTTETSRVYSPFPEFERTVAGGVTTERSSYSIAGQLVAVRVKSGSNSTLTYPYTDHLGSVVAMTGAAGGFIAGSLAQYEPFGDYHTMPAATANPAISDRGFTGHRQNNTGDYDFGLIYMNARYYLPEVGRFVSADTIVPDVSNLYD